VVCPATIWHNRSTCALSGRIGEIIGLALPRSHDQNCIISRIVRSSDWLAVLQYYYPMDQPSAEGKLELEFLVSGLDLGVMHELF